MSFSWKDHPCVNLDIAMMQSKSTDWYTPFNNRKKIHLQINNNCAMRHCTASRKIFSIAINELLQVQQRSKSIKEANKCCPNMICYGKMSFTWNYWFLCECYAVTMFIDKKKTMEDINDTSQHRNEFPLPKGTRYQRYMYPCIICNPQLLL